MVYTKEDYQKAAAQMQRDEFGHFLKKSPQSNPPITSNPSTPPLPFPRSNEDKPSLLNRLIPTGTNISKTTNNDTLLDIHIGNPLRKITALLQDIKKQKAFSFTLKGSLGIMGVILTLSVFGILGGGQILCNKGIQSYIGTVKALSFQETVQTSSYPKLSKIPIISQFLPKKTINVNRILLIKSDYSTIHLVLPSGISLLNFTNLPIIATGNYDTCSQTLTIKDSSAIEVFK